jgi:hypothetical protein
MASWHQRKAIREGRQPVSLADKTDWVIVTDPPNDMRTRMSFPDKASAEASLAMWRERGDRYSYILSPTGVKQ